MTTRIRVERVEPDRIAAHRAAWQDLVERCIEPNVFSEPAFVLAAVRHLHRPRRLIFLLAWLDETQTLAGLCPVVNDFAVAAVWTHPQATAAFPVLDKTFAAAAFEAFLATVADLTGRPAALLLQGLPMDGPTAQLLTANAAHPLEPRSRAILRRGPAPASLSGKARKELRRQWNRLSDLGVLTTSSVPAEDQALDTFLDLEARGWKGQRGTALKSQPRSDAFVRSLTSDLAAEGRCRLERLMLGDQLLAAGLLLTSGDRAYFWKTAYDERYARYSPGVQLVMALTQTQVGEPHVALTDSCAISGHTMIDRLWPDRLTMADYLVPTADRGTATFRIVVSTVTAWRRLRSRLKATVARIRRLTTPTKV